MIKNERKCDGKSQKAEPVRLTSIRNFISSFLPVLGDVEGPLEVEVGVVVVVDELGYSVVVATGDHARRGFLGVN